MTEPLTEAPGDEGDDQVAGEGVEAPPVSGDEISDAPHQEPEDDEDVPESN